MILLAGLAPAAADPVAFEGGLYEIAVKLELPHLEDMTTAKVVRACLSPGVGAHGISVLSDNNPLSRCPIGGMQETEGRLTFEIACEGKNAGHATGRFRFWPDRFEGRIAMRMGGKNMTMTEVQSGRRVGACGPDGVPTR